jgi:predicted CXXCH cytochrome family protein
MNRWPARVSLLVFLLAVLVGCENRSETQDQPTTRPSPDAAAPENYLQPKATVVAVAMKPQAPKPTESLPKGASCVTAECHAKFTVAAQIHRPISEKACDSCHAADVGGHRYPLKRGTIETCTFCHAVAGTQSHQHAPLKDGCTTCHQPHAGPTKFLLKADSVEQLCRKCHDVPLQKFAHEPFARGQCTLCHEPHQSANAKLLRGGEGKDHCLSCHSGMKQTLATASLVHDPVKQGCTSCHNPHASQFAHELKLPVESTCLRGCHGSVATKLASAPVKHAAMTAAGSCANCHNPHASNQKHLLANRTDVVCVACHQPMQKTLAASKFLHGPIRAGECSACHDAHGGQHPALLDRAFPQTFYTSFDVKKYELCFSCHDPQVALAAKTTTLTNFRNADTNLHYLHVNREEKGRSCKTCHAIHGSNLPNHMASSVPFEGSNWAMPLEYEKTERGGSCTPGCHVTRSYERGSPATVITATSPTTRGAS